MLRAGLLQVDVLSARQPAALADASDTPGKRSPWSTGFLRSAGSGSHRWVPGGCRSRASIAGTGPASLRSSSSLSTCQVKTVLDQQFFYEAFPILCRSPYPHSFAGSRVKINPIFNSHIFQFIISPGIKPSLSRSSLSKPLNFAPGLSVIFLIRASHQLSPFLFTQYA